MREYSVDVLFEKCQPLVGHIKTFEVFLLEFCTLLAEESGHVGYKTKAGYLPF